MDPRVTYWMIATEQGRDRDERARERLSRLVAHPGPERHHRDAGERGIAALVARLTRSLLFRRPDGPGIGTSSPTEA